MGWHLLSCAAWPPFGGGLLLVGLRFGPFRKTLETQALLCCVCSCECGVFAMCAPCPLSGLGGQVHKGCSLRVSWGIGDREMVTNPCGFGGPSSSGFHSPTGRSAHRRRGACRCSPGAQVRGCRQQDGSAWDAPTQAGDSLTRDPQVACYTFITETLTEAYFTKPKSKEIQPVTLIIPANQGKSRDSVSNQVLPKLQLLSSTLLKEFVGEIGPLCLVPLRAVWPENRGARKGAGRAVHVTERGVWTPCSPSSPRPPRAPSPGSSGIAPGQALFTLTTIVLWASDFPSPHGAHHSC